MFIPVCTFNDPARSNLYYNISHVKWQIQGPSQHNTRWITRWNTHSYLNTAQYIVIMTNALQQDEYDACSDENNSGLMNWQDSHVACANTINYTITMNPEVQKIKYTDKESIYTVWISLIGFNNYTVTWTVAFHWSQANFLKDM